MADISKRSFLILGAGALALGAGYAYTKSTHAAGANPVEYAFLPVAEMKARNALIVDIRTPPEWRQTGVIDGAKLVTFTDANSFLATVGPELADGRELILICHSGNRSSRAAEALKGRITNHIVSINGGMSAEISQGYQTVRPTL